MTTDPMTPAAIARLMDSELGLEARVQASTNEIMARWNRERAGACRHDQPCPCPELVRQEIAIRLREMWSR